RWRGDMGLGMSRGSVVAEAGHSRLEERCREWVATEPRDERLRNRVAVRGRMVMEDSYPQEEHVHLGARQLGSPETTGRPSEELARLVTEQPNPATEHLDELSAEDVCRLINDEDHRVAPAVRQQLPSIAAAVETIAAALRSGGRLFYIGAGTS